jgi:hypothetical protein
VSANVLRYVLDWVPFLIFLGLLIFILRKTGFGSRQAEYIAFMQRYCSDHLDETRKIGDSLQRIANALENRPPNSP